MKLISLTTRHFFPSPGFLKYFVYAKHVVSNENSVWHVMMITQIIQIVNVSIVGRKLGTRDHWELRTAVQNKSVASVYDCVCGRGRVSILYPYMCISGRCSSCWGNICVEIVARYHIHLLHFL